MERLEQSETLINTAAVSDSNSSSNLIITTLAASAAKNADSSTRKFKGVVLQPNGHWGAQIYSNHQRIWLGTFKTQVEAAMAYDSAAMKVRGHGSHRNLPWTAVTLEEEPKFQSQFTTETVLNMIKDGSYQSKFEDYLIVSSSAAEESTDLGRSKHCLEKKVHCCVYKKLFHKQLTPSDVGKLNRFVIPKKFALMYFPPVSDEDMELVFLDREMKKWKFRYCYWKSSQSFVFTRGWNRFVKEKGLKAEDKIIFSLCECNGRLLDTQSLYMIDLEQGQEFNNHGDAIVEPEKNKNISSAAAAAANSSKDMESKSNGSTKINSFRLFGAKIDF